ncbi:ABC transporter substrate binding protein [Aminivibrio sp.]|uniref:ABC transporter substrate binding protein n=1 Tax=Aminivibrio sp. TaxID=1872489 RepID=UPI001A534997|nr:ABC transporter substrate binding protein [Aminivibrio sp.]MBL3539597.1 HD domain-containing protein [Aminivibrio sp.]
MTAPFRRGKQLLVIFVLLLQTLVFPAWASENRKVLLLHTLSPADEWTRRATDGILSFFSESDVMAEFFIEYMDMTSTFWSAHLDRLKDLLEAKYSSSPPSVVIATGNEAVTFALVNSQALFGGAPIVYCGLSNKHFFSVFPDNKGTGVYSVPAHALLISEIARLHPGASIAFVSDLTPAGLRDLSQLNSSLVHTEIRPNLIPLSGLSAKQLADSLRELPANTVIMLGSHSSLPDGSPITMQDTLALILENASLPVYTLNEDGVRFGALASVAGKGYEKGRKAGEMAVRILSGEPVQTIPAEKSMAEHLVFDYRKMKLHSIPRSALSDQSVILNDPAELAARYFPLALLYIGLPTLLGGLVFLLKGKIAKRKRTEKNLRDRTKYWEQLFRRSPEGVVVYNEAGEVLETNSVFRATFALSEGDLAGANIATLLPWEKGTLSPGDFFSDGRRESREVQIPDRDGILISATHHSFPLVSGREKIYCSLVQNISQRKELEKQLEERGLFQETLSAILSRFILSPSYHDAMRSSLEDILALSNAKTATLYRLSGRKGTLAAETEVRASEESPSLAGLFPSEQEEDFLWKSLLFREGSFRPATLCLADLPQNEKKNWLPLADRGISSVSVLPLFLRDSFQGFLALADPSPGWRESMAEPVFDILRNALAAAMERYQDEVSLERNHREINERFTGVILALCQVSELRDVSTAGHQKNVSALAEELARRLGLPEETVLGVRYAGLVHDIGKLYIPAEILSKPSKLTPPEYELVKKHPEFGKDILSPLDFPWPLAEIILQHHERIDGGGYPLGKKKDEIRIEARILSVADTFDAMTSERPYRKMHSPSQAAEEIRSLSGKAYDPEIVEALEAILKENPS